MWTYWGCRTANGWDINHDPDVNGQMKDGRGNICPVTIIMPTLAMEALEKSRIYAKKDGKKLLSFDVDPVETFMNLSINSMGFSAGWIPFLQDVIKNFLKSNQ